MVDLRGRRALLGARGGQRAQTPYDALEADRRTACGMRNPRPPKAVDLPADAAAKGIQEACTKPVQSRNSNVSCSPAQLPRAGAVIPHVVAGDACGSSGGPASVPLSSAEGPRSTSCFPPLDCMAAMVATAQSSPCLLGGTARVGVNCNSHICPKRDLPLVQGKYSAARVRSSPPRRCDPCRCEICIGWKCQLYMGPIGAP